MKRELEEERSASEQAGQRRMGTEMSERPLAKPLEEMVLATVLCDYPVNVKKEYKALIAGLDDVKIENVRRLVDMVYKVGHSDGLIYARGLIVK